MVELKAVFSALNKNVCPNSESIWFGGALKKELSLKKSNINNKKIRAYNKFV